MVVYRPGAADGGMEGLCLSLVSSAALTVRKQLCPTAPMFCSSIWTRINSENSRKWKFSVSKRETFGSVEHIVSFWSHYCGQRGKDLQSGGLSVSFYARGSQRGCFSLVSVAFSGKCCWEPKHKCKNVTQVSLFPQLPNKTYSVAIMEWASAAESKAGNEIEGNVYLSDLMGRVSVHEPDPAQCFAVHTCTCCLHRQCVIVSPVCLPMVLL